jgi:2-dehydropantoate 2-reductase
MIRNVTIIGLGAIGRLVAANIIKKGISCRFLDSRVNKQHTENFIYRYGTDEYECTVRHKDSSETEDLYILTLKSYLNKTVISELRGRISSSVPIVVLQNGMGNCETVGTLLPDNQIIPASIEAGAYRTDNITVHAGSGAIFYNAFEDLSSMSTDHLPWIRTTEIKKMMLMKLAANSVINPLTAILKKNNGALISYKDLVKNIILEIYNVIRCIDCSIDIDELEIYIWNIIRKTANNQSSMLSDITYGRKTEIDCIAGYVINQAEEYNIAVPLLKKIYSQVKALEENK